MMAKCLEELINAVTSSAVEKQYKRTFLLENGKVVYKNNSNRITNNRKWELIQICYWINTFRLSKCESMHACGAMVAGINLPWRTVVGGKCTFCDISLDYIKIYEPVAANLLCDRMEK
jgi:hypothetical protein